MAERRRVLRIDVVGRAEGEQVGDLDAFELSDDQGTRPEPLPFARKPPPPPPVAPTPTATPPAADPRAASSQAAPVPEFITSLSGGSVGDSGI